MQGRGPTGFSRIVACVDGSEFERAVVSHAAAVARAFGAPLTLLRVVEGRSAGQPLTDSFEWDIRRAEIRRALEELAKEHSQEGLSAEPELMEGPAAEQICLWAKRHGPALTVVCTHGRGGQTAWSLASTARKLVDRAPGSFLLVPASAGQAPPAYRRILVPLDGSPRAESVLPLATRLAEAHGAELVLLHVVPAVELTEIRPLDAEDLELRERLQRRNQRVASEYLDRVRARLAATGLTVRALVLLGGDVRSRLARFVAEEGIDLMVLSAHGRSGRSDVPFGSVTAYLTAHATAPLLVLRPPAAGAMQRVAPEAERAGVRLPSQATP
jgi:nucleotide-binding universal stress UspA family protein